ncbi:adenylate/guanylate cyclase domain-containing protein [Ruegeria aquimaris]|uniref:Adenylate/guanylate cyclase domain-containing protein n=1 Tax=Ruegeria aquimaris TaxID=2984333 RepID=A0ABT3AEG7_9RHOB|nr:adenylate/guanylate cyclase domain-containing protein [Ruegeria sp. XHP0148]MCV2887078.1 adenylate/guanylate cyclase domain-containing protein [Ruegeria sp. XHP0148]
MKRRLSTIMAADVVGYSARMQRDETETIERMARLTSLLRDSADKHNGRIFNRAGDGFFLEFSSPVAAVRCAYGIQLHLAQPASRQDIGLDLRIGMHLADVIVQGEDLFGDGVNIASRIEGEAEPGAVVISGAVFEYAKRGAQLRFEKLGERTLKNIEHPVTLYSVIGELGMQSLGTAVIEEPRLPEPAGGERQANSIAVVPFRNLSSDPDQEYFAEGLTDDLITELARFPDVTVISRNASFGLKGIDARAPDIGRSLAARFCLEGGVRRLGSRIRISAHLTDTVTNEQVWAERADCSMEELFDVQDDLVAKIVSRVAGQIERQAEARARRKRPMDLEAYECLIRGLSYYRLGGVTLENTQQALRWFDEALKRDPEFGRAHAWRACALATVAEWTGEDVWDELVRAGKRAIELDETDAESHRIAGSLAFYQSDFELARYHFDRALDLNPSHAYVVGRTGELYNFLGDGKAALTYLDRAKMLDPFLPEYCRELEAVAHYVLGDFETCFRVVGEFARLTRRAAAYRSAAATQLNQPDLVKKSAHDLLMLDPQFDPELFVQTEYYKDRDFAHLLRDRIRDALSAVAVPMAS